MTGVGTTDRAEAEKAFARGADVLRKTMGIQSTFLPPASCGLEEIGRALDRFELTKPATKRAILEACARVAIADDTINSHEAELLRAIGDTVGVPLPPFVR